MAMVEPGFWNGRSVLVTGHTGFKGGWMSLWLQAMGARVTGFSLDPPSDPSLFAVARVEEGMTHVHGDLRDLASLKAAIDGHRPEIIVHLAAQAVVRASYEDPVGTYASNVMGTVNLLEAARGVAGPRAVVIVTSDKCYENRELPRGYREDDAMGGYDPYSSSKGAAELVCAAYRNSFFNPADYQSHGVAVASARAGNVIGGGDWGRDRLLPDLVRAYTAGEEAVIRYPDAVRPWQQVLDPIGGYLILAQRLCADGPAFAEAWNFGPGADNEKPVRHVVERTTGAWGGDARWRLADGPVPHEAGLLKVDASKARERLGWHPRIGLEEALGMTIDWYRAHVAGEDMRAYTLGQISEYSNPSDA